MGYGIQKALDMLAINAVCSVRDLMVHPEIGITTVPTLAKKFYDLDLDLFFRSTVSKARYVL